MGRFLSNDRENKDRTPRTIVVGDIHGCYREAEALISGLQEKGKYIPETDRLIFIGDYIDRGDNPRLAVKYVRGLQEKYGDKVIALKGNHEDMMQDHLLCGDRNWTYNGNDPTLRSYQGHKEDFENDLLWIDSLPLYYEDDYFIYVHAGIDKDKPMDQQLDDTLLWARQEFYGDPRAYGKKVVFGHTPTLALGEGPTPLWFNDGNDIDIDTGCVFGGKLTALIIEKDQVVEYHQVNRERGIRKFFRK